jgi:hypothetical protein
MVAILAKMRWVISVDLSDDSTTKAVLVASDSERFLLEKWEFYSEQNSGTADLADGYKPEAITAVLGDAHTLCFAVPELDSRNIEMEKRKRGVATETQRADYLNICGSGILAAVQQETSDEIIEGIKATFPNVSNLSISQSMVALLYVYLRSYRPQSDVRTALLHCTSRLISLLVVQREMPVWAGTVEVKAGEKETNYSEIWALLQTASEKLGDRGYDLLLLAGDCDSEDVKEMHNFASHVELFSPYRNNAFELGRGSGQRRAEAQMEGHRLAVAIGGAGMLLERVGINLSDTDMELERDLPIERVIAKEQTAVDLAVGGIRVVWQKAIPFLLGQSRLIIASLIMAVAVFGYRYREATTVMQQLDREIKREQERATSFVDIRARQEEYNRKIEEVKVRTAAINEIGRRQMTVKTVLDELDQRIPNGLVFTELEVDETKLKLKGYAPERLAVNAFANRLGQSLGVFADVMPAYDDKTNAGSYEINCKYIGPVPANQTVAIRATKVRE